MYRLLPSLGLVEFFVFMPLWAIESSRALEWWLGLFSCMRSPAGTAKGENLLPPLGSNCRKIVFRGLRAYGATLYTFNLPST